MRKLLLLWILVGCGKSKATHAAPRSEPAHLTNQELVTAPLASVTSQAGTVAFTIDLPISLLKPAEVKDSYSTWEPKGAWFDTPSFTVTAVGMPMGPDEVGLPMPMAGSEEEAQARVIARAEKLPDGGYIHLDQRKDERFFELEVCRPDHDTVCCSVMQRADKPIAAFKETLQMAEKICRSMKVK